MITTRGYLDRDRELLLMQISDLQAAKQPSTHRFQGVGCFSVVAHTSAAARRLKGPGRSTHKRACLLHDRRPCTTGASSGTGIEASP